MLKSRSTLHKVNQDCYARLLRELLLGPCSVAELVEASGLHPLTIRDLMRTFRIHKVVHIAAWEKDSLGRDALAVFKLGRGRDAKRAKLTPAERQARYRARKAAAAAGIGPWVVVPPGGGK